jgi:tryptophan-rich sensory protein
MELSRGAPAPAEGDNGMRQTSAAGLATACVVTAQLVGARWNPAPTHPRTALWYAGLRKPSFTPPGPVFGLAWTALDALQGYAGYRLLKAPASPARTAALGAWAMNLLGIAGFSWVLFGRKRLGEALGVSAGMVVTSSAAAATAALVDRPAAAAGLPLLAWVAFATVLQEEVWRRNR